MKVRIWAEQADLFEISVLEQTAEVEAGTFAELRDDPAVPVVLIGRALAPETVDRVRSLAEAIFRTGRCLLIVPPYGDLDVGRYLDTPIGMRLLRRPTDSKVSLLEERARAEIGAEMTVRSDHVIETGLGAGVIATDGTGRPVVLRYQPRNTSGAAIVATTQLLSYTALSTEEDRQALLEHLLRWHNAAAGDLQHAGTGKPLVDPIDPGNIATILVALGALGIVDADHLRSLAGTFLDLDLDGSAVESVLEYLEVEGVLTRGAEGERVIRSDALKTALEDLGLHAYARELQEVAREHSEVLT